jgi:hypothetical protein
MDDSAVVPRLMLCKAVFGLQHERGKPTLSESETGRNADDSPADYYSSIAISHSELLLVLEKRGTAQQIRLA